MIILITGSTHTGKTRLAQALLEKYHYPYLSIDHLKMGLIRSGQTNLTPQQDAELAGYLWPIVREMIKTAVENSQNLIVEGCYIPLNWAEDFTEEYRRFIRCVCLVFTENYLQNHFEEVLRYENVIEKRLEPCAFTREELLAENLQNLRLCRQYGVQPVLIDETYPVEITL